MRESGSSYSKTVIEYFIHPRNVGSLDDPDGIGKADNGATVYIEITIKVTDQVITEARFKTLGCGAAIAASSITTELLTGKTVADASAITNEDIVQALDGLPTEKIHCSLLAEQALKAALLDYRNKTR